MCPRPTAAAGHHLALRPRSALWLGNTNVLAQARGSPLVSGMLPASRASGCLLLPSAVAQHRPWGCHGARTRNGTARRRQPCRASRRCWGSSSSRGANRRQLHGTASRAPAPRGTARACSACTWGPGGAGGTWGDSGEARGTVPSAPPMRQPLPGGAPVRAPALAPLVCAQVAPSCCHSTLCFLLNQGHSDDTSTDPRRQEYLGALPARSSLPARPPAVCKFAGSRTYGTDRCG